ncbi:Gfo/Idh/MocA family protein [Actomonas aquatica]|uniref:Gfo/Idh/MocA family oxidoreductase n=1 Tax=Actomonas aquatica TaxID=2866162 RepID=A0ABZ1CHN5_9BACT|nr:Gfo/Idh/MocA family oxidoreductase [Opitutus sp. WL0086]WRQ90099.1 Gfo/Idh/MocA family oxidoreductase [Opitutus sp. WL0086]
MHVALLGLTHPHASPLLRTLELLPEVSRISLWDAANDPASLAALPPSAKATPATTNLDAVLAQPDLRAVVLCERHDKLAALALQVIAAGKHLLVEKPVGLTAAEVDQVAQAAERQGVAASVLYVRRHHPCVLAARDRVRSGVLGAPLCIESRFLTTQVQFRRPESWLFKRAQSGGGILLWLGCHCLDLMQYVAGEDIVELSAMLTTRSGADIDVEDLAALTLRFRSGAIGTFHAGYTLAYSGAGYVNMAGYDSYFGYNARQGRIVWPDLEPRLYIEQPRPAGENPGQEETFPLPASAAYGGAGGEQFFRQFFAAMEGQATPPAPLSAAVQTARLVEAALTSSQESRFVKIGSTASVPHMPPFAGEGYALREVRRHLRPS